MKATVLTKKQEKTKKGVYDQEMIHVDKAHELILEAWDAFKEDKRVALAYEALDISKYCFDAYCIISESLKSYDDIEKLLIKAIELGDIYFGKDYFEENMGYFWRIMETRPYMRVRLKLAENQIKLGKKLEAMQNLEDMLILNPNDNQGARYLLLTLYLNKAHLVKAERLLDGYSGDNSLDWLYGQAIYYFIVGDLKRAKAKIKKAISRNSYVLEYVTRNKRLPRYIEEDYSIGDEVEAQVYLKEWLPKWKKMKGFMDLIIKNKN